MTADVAKASADVSNFFLTVALNHSIEVKVKPNDILSYITQKFFFFFFPYYIDT